MRIKHLLLVIVLAAASSSCVVDSEEPDRNSHPIVADPVPVPKQHPLPPPHPDDSYPTIPSPYDCISCHINIPKPRRKPIPSQCLRCHSDPHGGNYPPGRGRDFEPGEFPIDPKCLECHAIRPKGGDMAFQLD